MSERVKIFGVDNFYEDEFICSCGCGQNEMKKEFIELLQDLRDTYMKPMSISSGYRCPVHNSKVSSTGLTGPHTTGLACDIQVSGKDAHHLLCLLTSYDFTGIGINQRGPHDQRFIHIDLIEDPAKRPWVWSY